MVEYITKLYLAKLFDKKPRTIQRWIDEDRKIIFDNKQFIPCKDPGGCWKFKVVIIIEK
jgi:hypothetical protein